MIRFDGNSILIADEDKCFSKQISEALSALGAKCMIAKNMEEAKALFKGYDFDIVICNYYLPEGVIHQLVDWCSKNLSTLPLFTCIGYPFQDEPALSQKQLIAGIFSKTDINNLVSGLGKLLFNFQHFYESLLDIVSPEEIIVEVQVGEVSYLARPVEVSDEKVILILEDNILQSSAGILKFSFLNGEERHFFSIPGFINSGSSFEYSFKVHQSYLMNWNRFLSFLNNKQVKITDFLQKAAGL